MASTLVAPFAFSAPSDAMIPSKQPRCAATDSATRRSAAVVSRTRRPVACCSRTKETTSGRQLSVSGSGTRVAATHRLNSARPRSSATAIPGSFHGALVAICRNESSSVSPAMRVPSRSTQRAVSSAPTMIGLVSAGPGQCHAHARERRGHSFVRRARRRAASVPDSVTDWP